MDIIRNFFENDQDLRKVDSSIQCHFQPGALKGKVSGSQFKADVDVSAQAPGSLISIVIDLPLILTPFKGKVEEVLKRKLQKHLP